MKLVKKIRNLETGIYSRILQHGTNGKFYVTKYCPNRKSSFVHIKKFVDLGNAVKKAHQLVTS